MRTEAEEREIARLTENVRKAEDVNQSTDIETINKNLDNAFSVGGACTVWDSFKGLSGSTDSWQRSLAIVIEQRKLKRIKNPGEYSQYDILLKNGMSFRD